MSEKIVDEKLKQMNKMRTFSHLQTNRISNFLFEPDERKNEFTCLVLNRDETGVSLEISESKKVKFTFDEIVMTALNKISRHEKVLKVYINVALVFESNIKRYSVNLGNGSVVLEGDTPLEAVLNCICYLQEKKPKLVTSEDSRFIGTHRAILKFPKKVIRQMRSSKIKEMDELVKLNNEEVFIMKSNPEHEFSPSIGTVSICEPSIFTISEKHIEIIEELG